MKKILLMSAALFGVAAGGVFGAAYAQNSTSSTMSPPAPNASVGTPNPSNSIPTGSGTSTRTLPGSDIGSTAVGPRAGSAMPAAGMAPMDPGMTGVRPLRGQHRQAHDGMAAHRRQAAVADVGAPRNGEYRGGAGSPLSTRASNTTGANTRSEIAPRLPDPAAAANTPQAYLEAAQRALNANRTGAAQEALERAETRLLSRSTDPSMASTPDDGPMVQQIGQARRALAARDTSGAKSAISAAMASGG